MKLTRHNGRSGRNGAYNPKHNDRRFDIGNSEHIDQDRAKQNALSRSRGRSIPSGMMISVKHSMSGTDRPGIPTGTGPPRISVSTKRPARKNH